MKAIRKDKKVLIILWIIFNTVWVFALLPVCVTSIVLITNHVNSNWLKYFISLLTIGILQGLIISICQGISLWFCKFSLNKIVKLSLANIIGTSAGMVIFGWCFGDLILNNDGLIFFLVFHLSLFVAGFLWGLTAGVYRFKKIDWAIATGIAYPLWSLTHFILGIYFASPVAHTSSSFYFVIVFALCLYGLSCFLTIPKVVSLSNKYQNF